MNDHPKFPWTVTWHVTATVYQGATIAGTWSGKFRSRKAAIEAANKADVLRQAAACDERFCYPEIVFKSEGYGAVTQRSPRFSVSCAWGATSLTRIVND